MSQHHCVSGQWRCSAMSGKKADVADSLVDLSRCDLERSLHPRAEIITPGGGISNFNMFI